MKRTEQKIINFIEQNRLIDTGDKILVALSGGPDSVFVLHFFFKYRRKFGISLFAVHFNHQLRGKESDADELFCEKVCEVLSIPFYSCSLDVKNFAKANKLSIEEAARNLRYKNLDELARDFDCTKIVTAHNQNDNTETVLLNILSGTGISGFSGIPVKRGNIIRPLLSVTKEEILEYLKKNRIPFRIDSSNLSDDFKRNYLRNQIIPKLKEGINPALDSAVFRSSKSIESFLAHVRKKVTSLEKKFVVEQQNKVLISLKLFDEPDENIIGEVLKKILRINFNHEFSYNDFVKIISLNEKQKGKSEELSKNIVAHKEVDTIIIGKKENSGKNSSKKIEAGKTVVVSGKKINVEKIKLSEVNLEHPSNIEYVDASELTDIFTLRKWENGDKFIPLGMKGTKKVSDFLTDQKIQSAEKKNQLVLLNRNKIVWVVGLRIDERFKITKGTKEVYKLWIN
ncbi:MAG: tRNA lysidine(34) synthetase TilS [Ignavibacteriales bacterium]|nr:tRNA lysidine(34) synthetase TilS [Ignavibacteriales bacterium]